MDMNREKLRIKFVFSCLLLVTLQSCLQEARVRITVDEGAGGSFSFFVHPLLLFWQIFFFFFYSQFLFCDVSVSKGRRAETLSVEFYVSTLLILEENVCLVDLFLSKGSFSLKAEIVQRCSTFGLHFKALHFQYGCFSRKNSTQSVPLVHRMKKEVFGFVFPSHSI